MLVLGRLSVGLVLCVFKGFHGVCKSKNKVRPLEWTQKGSTEGDNGVPCPCLTVRKQAKRCAQCHQTGCTLCVTAARRLEFPDVGAPSQRSTALGALGLSAPTMASVGFVSAPEVFIKGAELILAQGAFLCKL